MSLGVVLEADAGADSSGREYTIDCRPTQKNQMLVEWPYAQIPGARDRRAGRRLDRRDATLAAHVRHFARVETTEHARLPVAKHFLAIERGPPIDLP